VYVSIKFVLHNKFHFAQFAVRHRVKFRYISYSKLISTGNMNPTNRVIGPHFNIEIVISTTKGMLITTKEINN
jgi:hypothetical protein